jgi:hypothetical protein
MRKGSSKYASPSYIGQRFGDRTVIGLAGQVGNDASYKWLVRCDCDAEHVVPGYIRKVW